MLQLPNRWEVKELPSRDSRWSLVERVAGSAAFQKAPLLRDILLYITARSLTEKPATISEHQIGVSVLSRGPDFDPNQDNIVRVRIRSLRAKLEAYFQEEGLHEPILLTIPKGSYVARFEPRAEEPESKVLAPLVEPPPPPPVRRGFDMWLAIPALLAALGLWFLLRVPAQTTQVSAPAADHEFYRELLGPLGQGPTAEARLVLSNPKTLVYVGSDSPSGTDNDLNRSVPVPAQMNAILSQAANHADEGLRYHFLRIADQEYTGIGEAVAAFHMGQLLHGLGKRVGITQARFLNWDAVTHENTIMLGSTGVNDWAHKNMPTANFTIVKRGVRNANPHPGEPGLYEIVLAPSTRTPLVDYAVIWMSQPLSGSRVLMLAGCVSAGTAGVGAFFADPEKMRPVYEKLRAETAGRPFPTDWQVVVRIEIRDRLPIGTSYVTHRIY